MGMPVKLEHWRGWLGIAAVMLPLLAAATSAPRAKSDGMLGKLKCIAIEVEEVGEDGEEIGITRSLLESYIRMGVKAKMPRLRIHESCENYLYLNLSLIKGDSVRGPEFVYYGGMRLELRRLATIAESNTRGIVTVWDQGVHLVGQKIDIRATAVDQVQELMTTFSDSYQEAGNR